LRTLSRQHEAYRGRYEGPLAERDRAYHQGTAWPYLLGPFVDAYLKAHDHSADSRARAAEFVEPLLRHLVQDGCVGTVAEIFDGDAPQQPRGCLAQAWSVGELIRVCRLIHDGRF
jgi:glycogen debranching enzyme